VSARRPASRTWVRGALAALAVGLLLLAFFPQLLRRAPEMARGLARDLWSLVAVRRVEGHAAEIRAAAAESGVDPCLLAAVMYTESHGRADAVSARGALGAFQLMPSAAGDAARKLGLPEPSRDVLLSDVQLGARLAAAHLAWLFQNEGPDEERVLVAYNAGRGTLGRLIKDAGSFAKWRATHAEKGDSEVLTYAQQVLDFADRFRNRGVVVAGASLAAAPERGGSAGQ